MASELYDPATGVWSLTGSMVQGRTSFDMVLLHDGNVLAAGGEPLDDDASVQPSMSTLSFAEVYNSTTGVWTQVSSLNVARAYLQMGVLPNGNVLAVGGSTNTTNYGDSLTNTIEVFNGSAWSVVSQPLSQVRAPTFGLAGLANGNCIIFGGTRSLTFSDVFDYRTKEWWHAAAFPQAIDHLEAVELQDKSIISAGGLTWTNPGQTVRSTLVYAPLSNTTGAWFATASMAVARFEHAMVVF